MKEKSDTGANYTSHDILDEKEVEYLTNADCVFLFKVNVSNNEAVLIGANMGGESKQSLVDLSVPAFVEGCVVKCIAPHAFHNHMEIRTIAFPESITEIGYGAFKNCGNLVEIVIPNRVTRIGPKAFWGCGKLRKITIPKSVTEIGDFAFNGCKNLDKIVIPKSLNRICQGVFGYCSGLKKIVIPSSVIEIGDRAFYSCENLTSISIPRSVKYIGKKVFARCSKLKQLVVPNSVLELGDCMLNDCENLTSLSLPNNVVLKGEMVLKNCKKIESVSIPNSVTEIVDNAFLECENLKEVTIPQSVTAIGQRAFMKCKNLKEIIFPNSLMSIGQRAFWDCYCLSEVVIPDTVTQIGDYAFFGCSGLIEIRLSKSISSIGQGTFFGCSKLLEIDLPDAVTVIGQSAFEGCTGLKKCSLPTSLIVFGELVFKDCKSLIKVTIPEGVTCLTSDMFYHCSQLMECEIPESVVEIGANAFNGCKNLKRIIIPNSVTVIGRKAFYDCSGLNAIDLPQGITVIQEQTFRGCFGLSLMCLPESLITIEDEAFMNCSNLANVEFPDSLNSIGRKAFWGCSRISNVVIPSKVTEIGNMVFTNCKQLVSIVVNPQNIFYDSRNNCNAIVKSSTNTIVQGCNHTRLIDSINTIGQFAFHGCNRIASIIIPDTVSLIETEAFSYCHNLIEVVIASSVTTIEDSVFAMCDNLETVFIPNSVVKIGKNVFKGCNSQLKIYSNNDLIKNSKELLGSVVITDYDVAIQKEGNVKNENNLNAKTKDQNPSNYDEITIEQFLTSNKKELERLKESGPLAAAEKINMFAFFDSLLFEIKNNVNLNDPERSLKKVFFEVMNLYDWYPLKFVKYIDVFNLADNKHAGSVEFYADFIHSYSGTRKLAYGKELITDTKSKVDLGNGNTLLDHNMFPLEQLYRSSGVFYREFEYCHSFSLPVYSLGVYAIKSDSSSEDGNDYIYDGVLAELISNSNSWQESAMCLKHWLDNFNSCYDEIANGVTNTFYFIGSPWKNIKGYNEIGDYVLRAYVGIDKEKGDYEQIRLFLQEFQNFIEQVTFDIIVKLKNQQILQTAKNGSITQAMIRNMSHNIRSHVSNNYTSENAYERLKDGVIRQTLNNYVSFEKEDSVFPNGKDLQLPYFIQYLNNRMDYLSEMTFEVPTMLTTKRFYANILKDFDRERILLNHISGISGFRYKFSLLYNGEIMSDQNDLSVSLPDVLGNQAVFNILENIIRNTAKHSTRYNNDDVVFNIELIENADFPGYYCVEIDNGIKEVDIEELVRKQNKTLNDSVLGEDGKLRTHGLGLLEMAVAAAFLRQINIEKIGSHEYRFEEKNGNKYYNEQNNLIILEAINKNDSLGYRFFLQKPKEFLLVGDYQIDSAMKEKNIKDGVQFISEEDFTKAMRDRQSFSHPFLLYVDKLNDETKKLLSEENDCKTLLPIRKVKLSQKEANELVDISNKPKDVLALLKEFVWKKYMQSMGIGVGDIYIGEVVSRKYSSCRQIVFENHSTKLDHETYWNKRSLSPELWVDNLSSYTQSKLPFFAQYSSGDSCEMKSQLTRYVENITSQLKMEIFEAYHNKLLVIDERIQRYAWGNFEGSSNNGGPIPIYALFESTNVIIPKTKLDPEKFDVQMINEIEKFLEAEIDEAFLLVHYGILERMYKTEQTITDRLEAWAKRSKRIVVTSGRGSHSLQLPDSVCYVNLSSVLNAFTENRNKYLINSLINQSRRKNE